MSDSKNIVLDVKGMTCQGCVNAVTRIVKRADPQAEVKIDLPSGRVDALQTPILLSSTWKARDCYAKTPKPKLLRFALQICRVGLYLICS